MTSKYLLSLDLGGSGGRALLYNTATGEHTFTTCAWTFPQDAEVGGFAFDLGCAEKWQALCQLGRQALADAAAQPDQVAGLSVTSMRHGLVLIDRHGQVLLGAPNRDARAFAEGMELQGERGAELYARTGHIPNPVLLAPRLLWVLKNHPEYLSEGALALTISDWMAYMLCGVAASEPTQAGETCLFDLKKGDWAEDIIRSLGLPMHIFPKIVPTGMKLGGLTQTAAEALGLLPGIPVATGGADTQLAMLALGISHPGEIAVVAGSTTPVMVTSDRVHIDPQARTWTGMYALPGMFVVESNAGNMGASLEWFSNLMYSDSPLPVAALCGDAQYSQPGAAGILSTLGAQLFNASALGLPVDGLTFSTMTVPTCGEGRSALARAVLEGIAYSVRQNVEQALAVAHAHPPRLHLGGGITRSRFWAQLISDVFCQPVDVGHGKSASSFGAVLCAAVGAGLYPDLAAAAAALGRPVASLSPGAQAEAYAELYPLWVGYKQNRSAADEIASGGFMSVLQRDMESTRPTGALFKPRIYVSANAGEEAIAMLRELGEVTYASYAEAGSVLSGDELAETLHGYQVLVTEVDLVDAGALQQSRDLRVVIACRGNPVNIDIPACTAAGIPVINTPGRNADAVADLTVAFMLMLARKLDKAAAFLHEPGAEAGDMGRMGQAYFTLKGRELWRKTIGVVGGGAIGQKVIRRLLPFEARLLVYDPYLSPEEAARVGAVKTSLETLLGESDIVTLHAPANDDTTGMIGAAAFEQMKPGAYLINTARAALVDHEALLHALQSGRLGGAAFDVFPVEPPGADDPLLAFDNVIATPHIGGNTTEVGIHQGYIIVEELKRLLAGQKPKYALNPEVLADFTWSGERHLDSTRLAELAQGPGPGMTDLDVNAKKQEGAVPAAVEGQKSGGLLGGLRRLVTGKARVEAPTEKAAPIPSGGARAEAEARYAAILERFLVDLAADPAAGQFAKSNKVSFQFVLKYTAISFYMGFGDGKVDAGLGEAHFKPDVTVKVDADTFDGMFTGRIDGTQAFKAGKLSVSGNMLKAMSMQKLNFGPVYAAARDASGGAGDLTLLGPAAPAVTALQTPAAAAAPAPGPAPAPAVIHRTGDVRDLLLEVNNEMYKLGLITSTGGNISVRTDDNPNQVWITPSGLFKGSLRADSMVRIDLDGNLVGDAPYNASSERKVHCAIYRCRPEIKAVIHSHARYSTLMALTGTSWLPISADAAFFGEVPVVPFIMPGSPELGDAVAAAMGSKGVAAIMQNHGLVVAGSDLRRAADTTEAVEHTAEKLLWCRKMGVSPAVIPDDIAKILSEMGSMVA
jgi:sugar (pentulose or hexulose) kinase/phosphoglycerate dehydrogenase-like enzyme/ribulose-5-phosphate 4-epimerase/fuculose-1-phosphate aldolase/putative sterol carrier protein